MLKTNRLLAVFYCRLENQENYPKLHILKSVS